eukprot:SAG25_NODE_1414_length_3085_cov_58.178165_5_plen_132_part_00
MIAGCVVNGDKITVQFNKTLLKGDKIEVKPYNKSAGVSGAGVLGNASFFCAESALRCKMVPGNSTRPAHCGSPAQGKSVLHIWYRWMTYLFKNAFSVQNGTAHRTSHRACRARTACSSSHPSCRPPTPPPG